MSPYSHWALGRFPFNSKLAVFSVNRRLAATEQDTHFGEENSIGAEATVEKVCIYLPTKSHWCFFPSSSALHHLEWAVASIWSDSSFFVFLQHHCSYQPCNVITLWTKDLLGLPWGHVSLFHREERTLTASSAILTGKSHRASRSLSRFIRLQGLRL